MNTIERVKMICKERKIPISRLEKECGFSNGYIGQLRKGSIPDDRLAKIAEVLDLSVLYLMTGEELPMFNFSEIHPSAENIITGRIPNTTDIILKREYKQLINDIGKIYNSPYKPKLLGYVKKLVDIIDFENDVTLQAANTRTDIEITDEMLQHDDNIMADDDF